MRVGILLYSKIEKKRKGKKKTFFRFPKSGWVGFGQINNFFFLALCIACYYASTKYKIMPNWKLSLSLQAQKLKSSFKEIVQIFHTK